MYIKLTRPPSQSNQYYTCSFADTAGAISRHDWTSHPPASRGCLSCLTHRRAVVASLTMDRHASSEHASWRFTPSATTYTSDTRRLTTPRRRLLTVESPMVAGKRLADTRSPLTARYGRRDCPSSVHLHTRGLWSSTRTHTTPPTLAK